MSRESIREADPKIKGLEPKRRFKRETWLELGLEALKTRGTEGVTIDRITALAGVTRGSFYWHFKSHSEFLVELTRKWSDDFTLSVIEATHAQVDLNPRERLRYAIMDILRVGRAGLDVQFRELATTRPEVKKVVDHVDALRTGFIRSIFEDLGYTGEDLETRVHAFVVLHSLETFVNTGLGASNDLEHTAELRLDFFLS